MRVVAVGGPLPYPANAGSLIRTLNLLVRLAARHDVTFVGLQNPDRAAARRAVAYLGDHRVRAVEVEHAMPSKSGLAFYPRLAANLVSTLPYAVSSFHAPALARAVGRLGREGAVDLLQAEWVGAAPALRGLPGVPRLLNAPNVETLIWDRYVETETNPLKRWYLGLQAKKYARFEREAFAEMGRVVAVSPEDRAVMVGRFGVDDDRVDVVDNGIDRDHFAGVGDTNEQGREPRRILLLGSLDWRPNLDAVGVLLDKVFPAVRTLEPSATIDVVGRNPPQALVKRAAETPGVTLHADVADVRPFLASATVMAVPLRVGGGSRLKVLESLAAGLPVVSTTVGAEGLCLRDGEHLTLADTPEAMAAELVTVLRDPRAARARAAKGRALVLERYDWDVLADTLERSWERCVSARRGVLV